jgi:iron complex outermembrane receptor protein
MLSAGLVIALGSGAVHAQTRATSGAAAAAATTNTIEELVVTAEKRAQSLQDVPVAVTAFTSEKRDLIGINTIADMTNFTPGLEYNQGNDRNTLRGVGRLTNVHAADISVAQYSDGIYTSSTVEAGKTPLFSDRVEVLRGPQGTLYGRNSIGGAINIISKRPTEDPYAEVRAQYQNFNHFILEAAASGPTPIPGIEYRLAGNWEKQTDGWFHNVVPGQRDEGGIIDQQYIEGQLKFHFNDHFDGWAKLGWAQWHNDGGGPGQRNYWSPNPFPTYESTSPGFYVNTGYACRAGTGVSNVVTVGGVSLAQACTNPAINNPREFSSMTAAEANLTATWIFASEWIYHFDGMDLKYTAGGTHYNYTSILPTNGGGPGDQPGISSFNIPNVLTGGSTQILPREVSEYQEALSWISHELNLSSTGNGPLQWIVGLYYYTENYIQPTAGTLLDQPIINGTGAPWLTNAVCPFTSGVCANLGTGLPTAFRDGHGRFYDDRPDIDTTSKAVYGQIDWKFTDTWKATLGLRYTYDTKKGTEDGRLLCFAVAACSGGFGPEVLGGFLIDLTQIAANNTLPGPLPKGVATLTTFDPATGFGHRVYDDNWSATTGTAGIQWDPAPGTMAYFRYSRGYKAGGFNVGASAFFNSIPETNPEHNNAFEIGLKKDFGHTFQANAAIFYYDYSNAQVPITIINTSGGVSPSQGVFYNVPKSISQGFELETIWQPLDHLQLLFNYSYLDAHVDSAKGVVDPADPTAVQPGAKPSTPGGTCAANPAGSCDIFTGNIQRGQDLSGNDLPNAPRNKVAFNANYTYVMDHGSLTGSASYVWRDKQYGSIFNRPYYESPSWDQVDLRLTYKDKANKYTVIAWVKNVADSIGYEGGAGAARQAGLVPAYTLGLAGIAPTPIIQGIGKTYTITPPRTYGIELQYRFF